MINYACPASVTYDETTGPEDAGQQWMSLTFILGMLLTQSPTAYLYSRGDVTIKLGVLRDG